LDQFQEKAEQENPDKPPLGCKPRWLADEERLRDLESAIERYEYDGYQVPQEWGEEAREIIKRQEQRDEPARPAPASELVKRVHSCIVGEPECGHMQARAVIREVGDWLEGQRGVNACYGYVGGLLREEASQ